MGFRERFKRDEDSGDDGRTEEPVTVEPVTVGDVTISLADPETPEPVYTKAPDSPAAEALNELLSASDTERPPPVPTPAAAPPTMSAPAAPEPPTTSAPPLDEPPAAPAEQDQGGSPDSEEAAREALVRPRLASWQTAALGSPKKADEDRLFEEAALGRFERKAAPHLAAPAVITPAAPPATPAPPVVEPQVREVAAEPVADAQQSATSATPETSAPEVAASISTTSAADAEQDAVNAPVDDLDIDEATAEEEAEDSDRALARRASKLLERGDLSPDDPEVVHLLEVVNSSGERARPGELVDLTRLPASERTRLIIRVLCGLVAELPVDDAPHEADETEKESEAATA